LKLGRPLGRPRGRASLLGHPGTSAKEEVPLFSSSPRAPLLPERSGYGGLLTLTLRGKAMDGLEAQQERNRPQLCPPSLENRRTDAGFPQASTGRRRSVAGRSLGLSFQTTQTLATQSTRPLNRGRIKDRPSLWPEIHSWYRKWAFKEAYEIQTMGLYSTEDPGAWRAVASSSNRPENIEGWHSPNLLVITDEAKALGDDVRAAIRGAMTGSVLKELVLSTPPMVDAGWYCDLFGKDSHGWERIHIMASLPESVEAELPLNTRKLLSGALRSTRVSASYVEDMARDFGLDNPVFQAKVLGIIPEAAAEAVLHKLWIERAQARPADVDGRPVVLTCDVAREGEDLSVIGKLERGRFGVVAFKASNTLDVLVGMCANAVRQHKASKLVIDGTGVGAGVVDELRAKQGRGEVPKDCAIISENFGEAPSESWHGEERYAKRKDELWWHTRQAFQQGKIGIPGDHEMAALALPRDTNLVSQLASPVYDVLDSTGKLVVWDKRPDTLPMAKKRRELLAGLSRKSPDLAHALILGCVHYFSQPEQRNSKELTPEEQNRALYELHQRKLQESMRSWMQPRKPENRRLRTMGRR
jgi:hypothetical protein